MGMLTFSRFLSRPYPNHQDGPTIFSFQQKLIMDDAGYRRGQISPAESPALGPTACDDADSIVDAEELSSTGNNTPGRLSRNPSFSNSSSYQEDWDTFPPLDKLTVFDLLDNFSLSHRLEKWQQSINVQREKVNKQRERLKNTSTNAKDQVVKEWKRRAPTADEKLDKYRRRMRNSVERLGKQWNATATVSLREKISFISGVLNIFISGYLIGAYPEYFYIWFSAQLVYFMPIRYYRYHKKGYH